jgi:hypothetical protein
VTVEPLGTHKARLLTHSHMRRRSSSVKLLDGVAGTTT